MKSSLALLVALCLFSLVCARKMPDQIVLNAPFTPFNDDATRSVNTAPIAQLAPFAASVGVNTIWTCGGLGQFDTMTVPERKAVADAWVTEGHKQGLYVIVHVGTDKLSDAQDMAAHALAAGADAIAAVPPVYESGAVDIANLLMWLNAISSSAPSLPFFYYHIPSATHVDISITSLLEAAQTQMPNLLGVKYVSPDLHDYLTADSLYGDRVKIMFAPEPKIAGIPLTRGGKMSPVLAEDFFSPSWLRMQYYYERGMLESAQKEQLWKFSVAAVFGKYGGGYAERYIYRQKLNVDLGPARWPGAPLSQQNYEQMIEELKQVNFFNMSSPSSLPPSS